MMHRQVAGNMVSYGPFPVVGMEGALDRSPQKERQVVPAKSSGRIRFSKEKKTLLAILRVCDFFWDGDFFVTISIKIFGDLRLRHQVGSLWITSLKSCDLWLRKVFSSILFGVFDNFWLLTNNLFTFRAFQSQSTTTFDKSVRENVWCLSSTNPVRAKITLILCKCIGHADEVLNECHMLFASSPKMYETSEKRCQISLGKNFGMLRDTP